MVWRTHCYRDCYWSLGGVRPYNFILMLADDPCWLCHSFVPFSPTGSPSPPCLMLPKTDLYGNTNRAAITSGFLSVQSMWALPGKRPKGARRGRSGCLFSWLLPCKGTAGWLLPQGKVILHLSSQPLVSFDKCISTEKHHHEQGKNKNFQCSLCIPSLPTHGLRKSLSCFLVL